jgi:hypothetical protein
MKKILKVVDEKNKQYQITVADERWYCKPAVDEKTGLPMWEYVPSVTYVLTAYPKGKGFEVWLKQQGEAADEVKLAAANQGSRVHHAIAAFIDGAAVSMESSFQDSEGVENELSPEEYEAVVSFARWTEKTKPAFLAHEFVVWGEGYAGTVDILCKIGEDIWLVDLKTAKAVYESAILQLSAYKHASPGNGGAFPAFTAAKLGVLQVGYNRNKDGFKLTEVDDKYELFQSVKKVWENEHSGEKPRRIDLPLEVKLKKGK